MTNELCLDFEGGRYKVVTLQQPKCLRFGDVAAEQGKANLVKYSLGRLHKQCSVLEMGKHSKHSREVRAGWFSDFTWDWGSCPMVCL